MFFKRALDAVDVIAVSIWHRGNDLVIAGSRSGAEAARRVIGAMGDADCLGAAIGLVDLDGEVGRLERVALNAIGSGSVGALTATELITKAALPITLSSGGTAATLVVIVPAKSTQVLSLRRPA